MVIPGKTLRNKRILNADAESLVNIPLTCNHVLFEFDQTHVVSRLLEVIILRLVRCFLMIMKLKYLLIKNFLILLID